MFALKRITEPAIEPISLADAKLHLRVDFSDDDALISGLITAARQCVEDYTGRALISQQWTLALDAFPSYRAWDSAPSRSDYNVIGQSSYLNNNWNQSQTLYLARSPLISVDSIQYVDDNLNPQTLDADKYKVDTLSEPGRVLPEFNDFWPAASYVQNAVTINFTAGYGSDPSDVPTPIIIAMKLIIGWLYETREDGKDIPMAAEYILAPYKTSMFGVRCGV